MPGADKRSDGLVFAADGKKVRVFPGPAGSPVVYLNSYVDNGKVLHRLLRSADGPSCSLVVVSNLRWDDEMTPWECPALFAGDSPCHGEADGYLAWMQDHLMPAAERRLDGVPSYRAVAGYSLAGLFAVYALYRTDAFDRAASMSGSLWYPRFLEYTRSHAMLAKPSCLYFSLGDQECRSTIKLLQTVQERTEALADDCRRAGIETTFRLNRGNHVQHGDRRTADGILWILSHGAKAGGVR